MDRFLNLSFFTVSLFVFGFFGLFEQQLSKGWFSGNDFFLRWHSVWNTL